MLCSGVSACSRASRGRLHGQCGVLGALVLLACVGFAAGRLGGDCYPRPSNQTSIVLRTQTDMDNMYAGCTRIVGSLDVICASTDIINNLEVLATVTEITGYLHIEGCSTLPNLNGLRNLRVVGGQQLYSTPSEGGFAIFFASNPWNDLSGLEQLSSVSGGRVRISGPTTMCFLDRVNWESILGPKYYRLLSLSGGSYAYCQTRTCNSACSCGYCFGPTSSNCQGVCSSGDNTDVVIIVCLCVIGFFLVVILLLLWMCYTNRCGCRLRWFRRNYQWGALPASPISSWDSSKRRASVTPLTTADPFAVAMADYAADQQRQSQARGSTNSLAVPTSARRPSSDTSASRLSVPRAMPPVSIFPSDLASDDHSTRPQQSQQTSFA